MNGFHPDTPEHYRNQVVTGDARLLAEALPDASVDLIFTDPVYDQMADYLWLAQEANRVLKPNGALLVFGWISRHEDICAVLRAGGRPVKWICPLVYSAGSSPRMHPLVFNKWAPLYWAGGEPVEACCDTQISTFEAHPEHHRWTKNIKPLVGFVLGFCAFEGVIWDPFTGSASIPVACVKTGRNYIAFEIDPDTAEKARERVRLTPLPLLLPEPEPHPSLFAEVPA